MHPDDVKYAVKMATREYLQGWQRPRPDGACSSGAARWARLHGAGAAGSTAALL